MKKKIDIPTEKCLEIVKYQKTHTWSETKNHFKIHIDCIKRNLKEKNIPFRTSRINGVKQVNDNRFAMEKVDFTFGAKKLLSQLWNGDLQL